MRAPAARAAERTLRFDGRARAAFIVAALTLALCGAGFRSAVRYFNVHLAKEPIELRQHLSDIPRHLGRWHAQGPDGQLDEAQVEELGTDRYLNRAYALDGWPSRGLISVHIAYYTGIIDAVPHIPDRCFEGAGWDRVRLPRTVDLNLSFPTAVAGPPATSGDGGESFRRLAVSHPITGRPEDVHLPFGELQMRVTPFRLPGAIDSVHHAGYFFLANNHSTVSPVFIRKMAFRPSQRYAYYAKIQLEMSLRGEDPQPFVESASDLLTELLPHLMRCLPDWPQVEQAMERRDD